MAYDSNKPGKAGNYTGKKPAEFVENTRYGGTTRNPKQGGKKMTSPAFPPASDKKGAAPWPRNPRAKGR